MKLFDRDIRLAIFDMDGTLIDSTSIWGDIDREFFARRGKEVPPKYGETISHMGLSKAAEWTRKNYLPEEKEEDIIQEWRDMSKHAYEKTIPLKLGAKEILEALKEKGVRLALATANSDDLYLPCLSRLGILDYFESVKDVVKVKEGKNSSKIYDEIADEFNLSPNNIMVIEDILSALRVAKNAGYLSIGVYDEQSTKDIETIKQNCDHFFYDLMEFVSMAKGLL